MHYPRKQSTVYSSGVFGEYVIKDFKERYCKVGEQEFKNTHALSQKDMDDHGTQKFIVTIAESIPLDYCGFAFATPRARCTLRDFRKKPKLAPELTRGVALNGVVNALIWLHSKGAVHGDIKPDNVFVSSSGDRVFLADFGLCSFVPTNKAARKLEPASGTISHRYLWMSRICKFYSDAHSAGLLIANFFVPAELGGQLYTGDVVITLGQEATTQQVFEDFIKFKIGGPGAMYLPYLFKALRRDPNSKFQPIDANRALLSLRAATEDMMAKEKAELKRPRPLENRKQAPPSKRLKSKAVLPVIVAPAPAKPITLTKGQKRIKKRRKARAKRKADWLAQPGNALL
jgi:serine/threonine protein kinase